MGSEAFHHLLDRVRQDPVFRQHLVDEPLTALAGYDLTAEERLQVLVPNFGWLIEGRLAGASRPRTADALAALREVGVGALVSLSEAPVPGDLLTRLDLPAVHIPVADFTAPSLTQIKQTVAGIDGFFGARRLQRWGGQRPAPTALNQSQG